MTQNLHHFYYVQVWVCVFSLKFQTSCQTDAFYLWMKESGLNCDSILPTEQSEKKIANTFTVLYMCRKAKHQTSQCLCWRNFCSWSMAQSNTRCLMSLHYKDKRDSPGSHNRSDRSWVIFRSLSHLGCCLARLELEGYCYYIWRLIITRMSLRSTELHYCSLPTKREEERWWNKLCQSRFRRLIALKLI